MASKASTRSAGVGQRPARKTSGKAAPKIKPWRHRKGAEQPPPPAGGPMDRLLRWLADGRVHALSERAPLTNSERCTLSALAHRGRIVSLGDGKYQLAKKPKR